VTSENEIARLAATKLAEWRMAGIDPNPWGYRWPLGPFPADERTRTAPHGDPLMTVVDKERS
jgi:hypothetical protein